MDVSLERSSYLLERIFISEALYAVAEVWTTDNCSVPLTNAATYYFTLKSTVSNNLRSFCNENIFQFWTTVLPTGQLMAFVSFSYVRSRLWRAVGFIVISKSRNKISLELQLIFKEVDFCFYPEIYYTFHIQRVIFRLYCYYFYICFFTLLTLQGVVRASFFLDN